MSNLRNEVKLLEKEINDLKNIIDESIKIDNNTTTKEEVDEVLSVVESAADNL